MWKKKNNNNNNKSSNQSEAGQLSIYAWLAEELNPRLWRETLFHLKARAAWIRSWSQAQTPHYAAS